MQKKYPSLGVISNESAAGGESDAREKRRVPRLNLTSEQFRISSIGKLFPVADVSSEGMALRVLNREDLILFTVGTKIQGTLNIRRQKISVSAKVMHIGTELAGCQFESLSDESVGTLRSCLDPELLGQQLKPFPTVERGLQWWHGSSGTHLMMWRNDEGHCRKFALFVHGTFVQWGSDEGTTTGSVESSFEPSEVRGVVRFETLLLDRDARPDEGKLSVAKTVILSSNLSQDLRSWCVRQLQSGAREV